MNKIALIINTISKNKDIWNLFFDQLEKHIPDDFFSRRYIFVDKTEDVFSKNYETKYYDTTKKYREQFLSCIQHVDEKYCIYISEDYLLYDNIRHDLIRDYKKALDENKNLSFIRFMKGGVTDLDFPKYKNFHDLYQLHHGIPYFYTNQAALWRTSDLKKIHFHGPNLHIANKDWQNSFEFRATRTCQELDIQGLYCYHGEEKRGLYHYDSAVFPHISTALVKGKWNISEYPVLLTEMLQNYDININIRGRV